MANFLSALVKLVWVSTVLRKLKLPPRSGVKVVSSHFNVPVLGKSVDQVRSSSGNLIVDAPCAGQSTGSTFQGSFQAEEGDNIAGISVEDLLVRRICRASNRTLLLTRTKILDVSQDDIGRLAVELAVLATSLTCDM